MHYLLPRVCLFVVFLSLGYFVGAKNIVDIGTGSKDISFVENIGQLKDPRGIARGDIDFRVHTGERTSPVNVYVSAGMLYYQWVKPVDSNRAEAYQMRLQLIGANTSAKAIKEQEGSFYENYYISGLPQGSRAMGYGKVVYKNIYPNIDWVLYSAKGKLKYDFVVHEGGNVRDIKLQFEGDTSLRLEDGKIVAANSYGCITEDAPYAYEAETKRKVRSKFVLKDGVISIAAASHNGTLVIDPEILWRTYYGGWDADYGTAIAKVPGNGLNDYIFVAGRTLSWQNIVLQPLEHRYPGRDTVHAGGYMDGNFDGFLAAYTTFGRQQWATYYGGARNDNIEDMKYSQKSGMLYLGGSTQSSEGIATSGTHKSVAGGSTIDLMLEYKDGFVAKFDTMGRLVWGTYYGGEEFDRIHAIDIDDDDNIYVAGQTNSHYSIATPGTFSQTQYGGAQSGMVVKFSSSGQLLWGTYIGEYATEACFDVVHDTRNSIYVVGVTNDDTCGNDYAPWRSYMIASPGSHQPKSHADCPNPGPAPTDGFLLKFDANSGTRIWGTFYGGEQTDSANVVCFDSTSFVDENGKFVDGLIYIAGYTLSAVNIATPNGHSTQPNGGFIAAFKTDGERYWGTYSGSVKDMQIDGYGQLVTTAGTYKQGAVFDAGIGDYRFVIDNINGVNYYYGTGNTITRNGFAIGNFMQQDTLSDYPFVVYGDAYISRYISGKKQNFTPGISIVPEPPRRGHVRAPLQSLPLPFYYPDKCMGEEYRLLAFSVYPMFSSATEFRVQLSDTSGSFEHYLDIGGGKANNIRYTAPKNIPEGKYRIRLVTDAPICISDAASVSFNKVPDVKITSTDILCENDTLWLTATDTLSSGNIHYQWINFDTSFISIAKDTFLLPAQLKHSDRYVITSIYDDKCYDFDTINITVRPNPELHNVTNNSPVCAGSELKLNAFADTTGGAVFDWSGPGFSASGQSPVLSSPQLTDAGMYRVKLTKYGCSSEDSTLVVIDTLPATPEGMSNGPLCHGDTLKLFATSGTPGVTYLWRGPGNFSSTLASPMLLKMNATGSGVYTVTTKLGNCSSVPDSVEVIVPAPLPAPEVSSNSPVKEGDVLRLYANGAPGASYAWVGPDSFSSQEQNPLINDVGMSATGVYHVSATVNGCGSVASTTVVINGVSEVYFLMFPNPNDGTFRIKATMDKEQVVPIQVLNAAGQLVYETEITSRRRLLDTEIKLPGSLSAGKYHLRLRIDGSYKVLPFVVN